MKLSRSLLATVALVVGAALCFSSNHDVVNMGMAITFLGGAGMIAAFLFGDIED